VKALVNGHGRQHQGTALSGTLVLPDARDRRTLSATLSPVSEAQACIPSTVPPPGSHAFLRGNTQ
jgi:hypothetical protein